MYLQHLIVIKCFKFCGCGLDGKCHYCNAEDFIGYKSGLSFTNGNGPFGTNNMLCTSDTKVNIKLCNILKSKSKQ